MVKALKQVQMEQFTTENGEMVCHTVKENVTTKTKVDIMASGETDNPMAKVRNKTMTGVCIRDNGWTDKQTEEA
jgi:hypothetical protein